MSISVYGASDDLIEVEGDIVEELSYGSEDEGDLLGFSDGTLLRVRYDNDGVWRITPIATAEGTILEIVQAPADNEDNYSDVATLHDVEITWVVQGGYYARRK